MNLLLRNYLHYNLYDQVGESKRVGRRETVTATRSQQKGHSQGVRAKKATAKRVRARGRCIHLAQQCVAHRIVWNRLLGCTETSVGVCACN